MRRKTGTFLMLLGAALIFGALTLFLHNQHEAARAERAVINLLPQLIQQIDTQMEEAETEDSAEPMTVLPGYPGVPLDLLDPKVFEMTEVEIDGYAYIGYLSIPSLELELPIMADWDYGRLQISPCRYAGSSRSDDLVLMAHNYSKHFGRLSELAEGDSVVFTDMDGVSTNYEVVGMDILDPAAVAEMTAGDFDLTLFTCTYGGRSRVTVYCERTAKG